MSRTSAETDMKRAKDLRKLAREAKDAKAKDSLNKAADRLERRGATKAGRLGRRGSPVPRGTKRGGKGLLL